MKCCTPRCSIVTVVVGSILCIGSGLFLFFLPNLIDSITTAETQLTPSSIAFDMWRHIPVPVYRQFYVFNYTNVEEFIASNGTVKPNVVQLGPYTYQEIRNKVFLDWESNGNYIQYRETHTFSFLPHMSRNLSEDDYVITPNLPLVSTFDMIKREFPDQFDFISSIIGALAAKYNQTSFVNVTVGDLLFYGYFDPVLELAQNLTSQEFLPGSYYAMFYGINATDDGKYEINRGYEDIKQLYHIRKWNESTSINLWSMDKPDGSSCGCNMYNGTDGSFYWPGIERKNRITIFISSICRSIFMDYLEDMEFKGISGYTFASTMELFADLSQNPNNYCFCSPNASACIASGVAALGPCKFGSPIYISHPHFLFTDFEVRDAIDGLEPDPNQHKIAVSIEPNSGNLIRINVRFQINLRAFRVDGVEGFEYLPEAILLPVIWINESSQLDDDRVDLIHDSLILPTNLAYGIAYALISLTGFLICVGVSCAYNLMFRFKGYATHGNLQPTPEYTTQDYDLENIPRVKSGGSSKPSTYGGDSPSGKPYY